MQLITASQPWGRAAEDGWLRVQAPMVMGFLLTVYLLEIQQPEGYTTLKVGNFILVLGAMLVIRAAALRRARGELPPVHFAPHDYVYLCYILWLYASAFWTVAFAPTLVITTYLSVVWLATVSLNFYPPLATIRIFAKFAALLAAVSILIWPIFPGTALQPVSSTGGPELRGLIDHQLRFGMLMCMALGLVGIAIVNGESDALRGRWPRWMLYAAVLLLFAAILLSRARGCTAAFGVALMFSGLLSRNRTIMLASAGGLIAITVALLFYGDVLYELAFPTEYDRTLSGRTVFWPVALELAQDQHWTGYGYASFPSDAFERYWRYYSPPSAHNTFIQAYFETGLIGLWLVLGVTLMMMFSGLYISLTMGRISYSFFVALYVILAGILDTVLAGKLTILCTMMLLIAGQEANEFRQYRQNVKRGMA